jgi:hypothetical protein
MPDPPDEVPTVALSVKEGITPALAFHWAKDTFGKKQKKMATDKTDTFRRFFKLLFILLTFKLVFVSITSTNLLFF